MDVRPSPSADVDAGLERIKRLEQRLAREPGDTSAHREMAEVVRIEAGLYCRTLDARQAVATHSMKSERSIVKQALSGLSWK